MLARRSGRNISRFAGLIAIAGIAIGGPSHAGVFYDAQVVAMTGRDGITAIGNAASINSGGLVAFQARAAQGDALWTSRGIGAPTIVSFSPPSASRTFSQGVQINDNGWVVGEDTISGTTLLRVWNSNAPGSFVTMARAGVGVAGAAFDSILAFPTLSDADVLEDLVAGGGNLNGACDPGEKCVPSVVFSAFSGGLQALSQPVRVPSAINNAGVFTSLAVGTPTRPAMAANGSIVVRAGGTSADPILLYPSLALTPTLIAGGANGFTNLGRAPGAARTSQSPNPGTLAAFVGNRSNGDGVFIGLDDGSGTRQIVKVAGEPTLAAAELGRTINPAALPVGPRFFASIDGNSRVGIVVNAPAAAGLGGAVITVTFVATPNAACAALECTGPSPFRATLGLWAATLKVGTICVSEGPDGLLTTVPGGDDVRVGDHIEAGPNGVCNSASAVGDVLEIPVGQRLSFTVARIVPVAQVGDTIVTPSGARVLTAVSVNDPIALASFDDGGNPRIGSALTDHRVAYVGTAGADVFVVRASSVDSDADGLLDHWERAGGGLDVDSDGMIDWSPGADGANPFAKDLFVEYDWMDCTVNAACAVGRVIKSKKPRPQSIAAFVAAFSSAPIPVTMHAIEGEAVPEVDPILFLSNGPGALDDFNDIKWGSNRAGDPYNPCTFGRFGSAVDRADPNCRNILAAKRLGMRYVIFGQNYSESIGSSGVSELPGNDLMVTLAVESGLFPPGGGWTATAKAASTAWATTFDNEWIDIESATLMHEFGHALGLRHGGFEHRNCKPNYFSIMSYSRQLNSAGRATGTLGGILGSKDINADGVLDARLNRIISYSSAADLAPVLDENALIEANGTGGPASRTLFANAAGQLVVATTPGPIDWDGSGIISGAAVVDVNAITSFGCPVSPGQRHESFDDWGHLMYATYEGKDFSDGATRDSIPLVNISEVHHVDALNVLVPGAPLRLVGDIDGDGDVDSDDLKLLMRDNRRLVGASICGARCDLNSDGRIDVLDGRLLTLRCTRSNCATR